MSSCRLLKHVLGLHYDLFIVFLSVSLHTVIYSGCSWYGTKQKFIRLGIKMKCVNSKAKVLGNASDYYGPWFFI